MATDPAFFVLLKKHLLIWSIITSSSFNVHELKDIKYRYHSEFAIDIFDLKLSEEDLFYKTNIIIVEGDIMLIFYTKNPDYYNYPERYFGRSASPTQSKLFAAFGQKFERQKKGLGHFDMHDSAIPPASVIVSL